LCELTNHVSYFLGSYRFSGETMALFFRLRVSVKEEEFPKFACILWIVGARSYGLFFFVVCLCYRTAVCHSQWKTLSI